MSIVGPLARRLTVKIFSSLDSSQEIQSPCVEDTVYFCGNAAACTASAGGKWIFSVAVSEWY